MTSKAEKLATERGAIAEEGWTLLSVSRGPDRARVVLRRPPGGFRRFKSMWLTTEPVHLEGLGWIKLDSRPPVNAYGASEPRVLVSNARSGGYRRLKIGE